MRFWRGVEVGVKAYESLDPIANSIKALQKLRGPVSFAVKAVRGAAGVGKVVEGGVPIVEGGTLGCWDD